MRKTRICDLLGIEYPIIQGPMAWLSWAELVAAVSNAGGLGTIGPNAGARSMSDARDIDFAAELLRSQIRKARSLTQKPFAVNFTIGRGKQIPFSDRFVEVGIEEGIEIAIVSVGSSDVYTRRFKEAGAKVLHAVGSVKHAQKAEEDGVDAVICEGYEAGGHLGGEELTTLALVPQVVDAVKIPVIAAGGIADSRGLVAAFALGAEAVYMGTRFLATNECAAHPNMKQALVDAIDTSTVAFARKTGLSRCLKNEYTAKHIELESSGASFDDLRAFERSGTPSLKGRSRMPAAVVDGEIVHGVAAMGQISGLIDEIVPAAEVVKSMVEGSAAVLARLNQCLPSFVV